MSDLVTQPTFMPTRKVMAGLIAGIATLAMQALLYRIFPGVPIVEFMEPWEQFITPLAMYSAMYMTRERAVSLTP